MDILESLGEKEQFERRIFQMLGFDYTNSGINKLEITLEASRLPIVRVTFFRVVNGDVNFDEKVFTLKELADE
jgi:hypothetical protein